VKFSIIHIKELSCCKAQVYSVKYEGKDVSELQSFYYKFQDSHPVVIHEAFQRIALIAKRDGIEESFFKRESPLSHNVFRLLETNELRLYCIMFSNIILLFGSGGLKTFNTKTNKQNPHLDKEINRLIKIEDTINTRLKSGELKITVDGLVGNLTDLEI
jgi:hypothetical protein